MPLRQKLLFILGAITLAAATAAAAQAAEPTRPKIPPPYTPLTWDIDWSYLRDPTTRVDVSDRLHYVPLRAPDSYLSLTGQIRERGEYQDHPAFGAQPPNNGYFQQRYLASDDFHLGPHFRTFLQLASARTNFRDGGPRPGIDEDKFDFNQGFVDLSGGEPGSAGFTLRAGRQLVSLGSTRLVAIGAGLNVEQPFDGFRLTAQAAGWTAELLALRPTLIRTGYFDNAPNSAEALWGLYSTHPLPGVQRAFFDLYYLGLDHRQAGYTQGVGREQRETVGGRIWSHTPTWDYDFEYTGQFGRFGAGNIRAWGTGYHLGYTFGDHRLAPHPELDGGFLSGDNDPHDHTLGTFNPLFPNGNYLGQSILLGPYNLIITRPTLKLALTRKASSNTNVELLWRESTRDGVYNIVGMLTHPSGSSSARFVGSQVQEELDYSFTRHLSGTLTYEHFFPGAFLKQSPPGKSVNFLSPQVMWNF